MHPPHNTRGGWNLIFGALSVEKWHLKNSEKICFCNFGESILKAKGAMSLLLALNGSWCLTRWHCEHLFSIVPRHVSFPFIFACQEARDGRWDLWGHQCGSGFYRHLATRFREWWSVHLLKSIEHVDKRFISLPSRRLFRIDRCLQSSTKRWMSADIWVDCSVYCSISRSK